VARKSRKPVVKQPLSPEPTGVAAKPTGLVEFTVNGPVPRWAPYKKFRWRLYVPADTRAWRDRVAKAFLSAGGRRPRPTELVLWSTKYGMVRSHADLDSISHSLQDALSKDALRCVDKEWHIGGISHVHVPSRRKEYVEVKVEYLPKETNGR
jgi:hypothetical protein